MAPESRHIAVHVDRPMDEVYAYASEPSHLPEWAPGLCTSITPVDDHWVAESGMGSIVVRYAEPNPYGVMDHDLTLESVETPRRSSATSGRSGIVSRRPRMTTRGCGVSRHMARVAPRDTTARADGRGPAA